MALSGSFGLSASKSSGEQQAERGVPIGIRRKASKEALGLGRNLLPQFQEFLGRVPLLELNAQGLTPEAASQAGQLTDILGRSLFNKFSAGGATKGQTSFRNTSNVIGTAAEKAAARVLPITLKQAQDNVLFNTTSRQRTEALGFDFLQQLASIFSGLGASGGTSSGSQRSFSFGTSVGSGGAAPNISTS